MIGRLDLQKYKLDGRSGHDKSHGDSYRQASSADRSNINVRAGVIMADLGSMWPFLSGADSQQVFALSKVLGMAYEQRQIGTFSL